MSEWISVKDRLPEPNQQVLVISPQRYIYLVQYCPGGGSYTWDGDTWGMSLEDVSRWQPIPEVPEEA